MLPGLEMLACPDLAVSPEVMRHIVQVESGANRYAIGVVGGRLERQPGNLPEALATVQMLDAKGYNFSVGLAQVNRANLGRYGLDSYEKAFNACRNLSAGAHILADCYAGAHGDWGKAFSCYYSGNFVTGFRDGYVQKVYASIDREANGSRDTGPSRLSPVEPMALRPQAASSKTEETPTRTSALESVIVRAAQATSYRVALRSMVIDANASATVPAISAAVGHASPLQSEIPSDSLAPNPGDNPGSGHALSTATESVNMSAARATPAQGRAPIVSTGSLNDAVFVPEVRGPGDSSNASTPIEPVAAGASTTLPHAGVSPASQEQRDDAFVF